MKPTTPLPIELSNYSRIQKLSEGAYTKIYAFKENRTNKKVLIKISKSESTGEEKENFLLITQFFIRSYNPAILPITGFSSYLEKLVLISDYIPNASLDTIFTASQTHNSPNWTNTKKYINFIGIAFGMRYLHDNDFVHGDINPNHILLDENFYPKIKCISFSQIFKSSETKKEYQIFIPPEYHQFDENKSPILKKKSDVYSFAFLCYQLFTGIAPKIKARNEYQEMKKIEKGERPDLTMINDEQLKTFLTNCWSNSIKERYSFDTIVKHILRGKYQSAFPNFDVEEVTKYINLFNEEEKEPLKIRITPISCFFKSPNEIFKLDIYAYETVNDVIEKIKTIKNFDFEFILEVNSIKAKPKDYLADIVKNKNKSKVEIVPISVLASKKYESKSHRPNRSSDLITCDELKTKDQSKKSNKLVQIKYKWKIFYDKNEEVEHKEFTFPSYFTIGDAIKQIEAEFENKYKIKIIRKLGKETGTIADINDNIYIKYYNNENITLFVKKSDIKYTFKIGDGDEIYKNFKLDDKLIQISSNLFYESTKNTLKFIETPKKYFEHGNRLEFSYKSKKYSGQDTFNSLNYDQNDKIPIIISLLDSNDENETRKLTEKELSLFDDINNDNNNENEINTDELISENTNDAYITIRKNNNIQNGIDDDTSITPNNDDDFISGGKNGNNLNKINEYDTYSTNRNDDFRITNSNNDNVNFHFIDEYNISKNIIYDINEKNGMNDNGNYYKKDQIINKDEKLINLDFNEDLLSKYPNNIKILKVGFKFRILSKAIEDYYVNIDDDLITFNEIKALIISRIEANQDCVLSPNKIILKYNKKEIKDPFFKDIKYKEGEFINVSIKTRTFNVFIDERIYQYELEEIDLSVSALQKRINPKKQYVLFYNLDELPCNQNLNDLPISDQEYFTAYLIKYRILIFNKMMYYLDAINLRYEMEVKKYLQLNIGIDVDNSHFIHGDHGIRLNQFKDLPPASRIEVMSKELNKKFNNFIDTKYNNIFYRDQEVGDVRNYIIERKGFIQFPFKFKAGNVYLSNKTKLFQANGPIIIEDLTEKFYLKKIIIPNSYPIPKHFNVNTKGSELKRFVKQFVFCNDFKLFSCNDEIHDNDTICEFGHEIVVKLLPNESKQTGQIIFIYNFHDQKTGYKVLPYYEKKKLSVYKKELILDDNFQFFFFFRGKLFVDDDDNFSSLKNFKDDHRIVNIYYSQIDLFDKSSSSAQRHSKEKKLIKDIFIENMDQSNECFIIEFDNSIDTVYDLRNKVAIKLEIDNKENISLFIKNSSVFVLLLDDEKITQISLENSSVNSPFQIYYKRINKSSSGIPRIAKKYHEYARKKGANLTLAQINKIYEKVEGNQNLILNTIDYISSHS